MKKLELYLLTIFIITILSACANVSATPIKPNEKNMIITIKNNTNIDLYAIEINAHQLTELVTTSGISNADGSKLKKGDSLVFEFIDEVDFKLIGEASFEVILVGKEQNRVPLEAFTLDLQTNKKYSFEITGDSIEDAELKRIY
jgi:Tol biopolymer transport system component